MKAGVDWAGDMGTIQEFCKASAAGARTRIAWITTQSSTWVGEGITTDTQRQREQADWHAWVAIIQRPEEGRGGDLLIYDTAQELPVTAEVG